MDLLNSSSMKKIFNFELYKVRRQDKEDVKQDAIVRILKSLKTQEIPEDKLFSFCQTIIKRTVVDYYRHTNRKIDQASTSVHFCDSDYDSESGESSVDAFQYEQEELGYGISDIRYDFETNRGAFTPTEQKAIEFMLQDSTSMSMSLAEIANELQINKSHTTRAFKKLREMYVA